MKVSIKKTKVMVRRNEEPHYITGNGNQKHNQVEWFKYLGPVISSIRGCEQAIKMWVTAAWKMEKAGNVR